MLFWTDDSKIHRKRNSFEGRKDYFIFCLCRGLMWKVLVYLIGLPRWPNFQGLHPQPCNHLHRWMSVVFLYQALCAKWIFRNCLYCRKMFPVFIDNSVQPFSNFLYSKLGNSLRRSPSLCVKWCIFRSILFLNIATPKIHPNFWYFPTIFHRSII